MQAVRKRGGEKRQIEKKFVNTVKKVLTNPVQYANI